MKKAQALRAKPKKGGERTLATGSSAPAESGRTLERAIGNQVRALRRHNDLSISDLAAAAGISSGKAKALIDIQDFRQRDRMRR